MLLLSCKKEPCDNKPDFTYTLSEEDKKFIPYTGNERLVYLAPNLDTLVIFKGGGVKSYFEEDMEQNGECPTIYAFETKEYIYRAEHDPAVQIKIKLQRYHPDIAKVLIKILDSEYELRANGGHPFAERFDSLSIEGKVYYNVYKTEINDYYISNSFIYFSPNDGLIRYELPNMEIGTIPR